MSLDGRYDDANIFAKVLRGEAPAFKVYETEASLAFMDLFPQSEGHTLVAPKTPARNLFDISAHHLAELILDVQTVAEGLRAALNPDGVVLTQFNGAPAGQTIFHLHFHLIPRWSDRPLAGHGGAGKADGRDLERLAARISEAIKALAPD